MIVKLVGSPTEEDMWFVTNKNARRFLQMLPPTQVQPAR
jgi:hypothetical protein